VDTSHLLAPVTAFLGAGGTAAGVPGFVVIIGAVIVAVSSLTLWLELVVRAASISAAALFLPICLAALVWPAVSHWCRRLADTLAALVLSKFVVAAVLSLAAGAIAGGLGTEGANGGGFAAVVTGIAMLLIATLSPFTLLKLVPAIEAGAVSHLESVRHRLAGAARAPVRATNLAMDVAARAGSGSAAGGAGAAGAVAGGAVTAGAVAGTDESAAAGSVPAHRTTPGAGAQAAKGGGGPAAVGIEPHEGTPDGTFESYYDEPQPTGERAPSSGLRPSPAPGPLPGDARSTRSTEGGGGGL
jgi:type IV secretion system protein TrbL